MLSGSSLGLPELHTLLDDYRICIHQSDWCIECWIEHEQIDPHLLLGNADEFYKQDENGKWTKKQKEK